jgi:hypothetical protein
MSNIHKTEEPDGPVAPKEITYDGMKLTILLIAMIIPFYFGGDALFKAIWEGESRRVILDVPTWIKFAAVFVAIILHELIHGFIFAMYAKNGFKAIKFGFSATMGAFYCHCKDPLKVKHYRRAGIAPLLVLGIIPLIFAMITGTNWIKTFGLLLTIGGFGDLIIWIKLLKYDRNLMIRDHPDKMGFIVE